MVNARPACVAARPYDLLCAAGAAREIGAVLAWGSFFLASPNPSGPARPDLKEALDWIRRSAENGYADAQLELGRAFEDGRGVPQNLSEAARWYRKAAEQGHAGAQCALGALLESGRGLPPNPAEAASWYRSAAAKGHAEAQYRLGLLCAKGLGSEQNFAEAASWYRSAAEQGHGRAQLGLGSLAYLGLGMLQDYLQAHMWFNLAAAGLPPGPDLDRAIDLRRRVSRSLAPVHLVEAQRLARQWQRRHRAGAGPEADPVLRAALEGEDDAAPE
jgi:TPR repeat protein